jgi:hypothetical protein
VGRASARAAMAAVTERVGFIAATL